jgi:hypothetical protein
MPDSYAGRDYINVSGNDNDIRTGASHQQWQSTDLTEFAAAVAQLLPALSQPDRVAIERHVDDLRRSNGHDVQTFRRAAQRIADIAGPAGRAGAAVVAAVVRILTHAGM